MPTLWDGGWFDSAWEKPFGRLSPSSSKSFSLHTPSVEVIEDDNQITVRAEVPGMTEKDINLTWHDGVLRISGEKKSEKEEKKDNRFYSERNYGYFSRDIPIGDSVDGKGIKAKYRNGMLSVNLPKTEKARKAIAIKIT